MVHRVVQRVQPVGDLHKRGVGVAFLHPLADVGQDVLHLFKAVVVLGQDGKIRHFGADLPHAVPAQPRAVAPAAKHHHQPVGMVGPQGGQQAFGGHLVVGVVQQDGKLFADGHQLHPAFDHAAGQAVVDGAVGQAQLPAHRQGRQGVVDAELPGHVHLDVHLLPVRAADVEGHPQKIVGAQQLAVPCPVVGPGLHPVGHQAAGVAFQQGGGVGVVPVHHAQIAPLEQLALPAAVFLKGGVLAGPDVVGGQVGEHPHVVVDAPHPVHHQPLAGHLHHHRVAPGVHKGAEDLLQLVALGGGVGGIFVAALIVHAVGADHAHMAAGGLQHAADHVGGGGLALGAGDPDHGHPAGRVAEQVGAHQGHGVAAAGHLQDRDPFQPFQADVVLDDQRGRPPGGAVGGKRMAVPLGAHDADEQHPRGGLAAVVHNIGDLGVHAALHQGALHPLGQRG